MTPQTPAVNAAGELLPEQPKSVYSASGDLTGSYTGAARHTPGPWAFARYSKKRFGVGQCGEGAFFFLQCVDDDTENPQAWADARLMTAAPDMLKTLSDMDGWLANTGHGDGHPWRISIRAAIAKATGAAALATQGVQL